jgi:PilZ domain
MSFKVGVRFDRLEPAQQARLDRYVFGQMRREAREKRHVRGTLFRQGNVSYERRRSHRVDLRRTGEQVAVGRKRPSTGAQPLSLADQAKIVASDALPGSLGRYAFQDISATGCAFLCDATDIFKKRDRLHLELELEGDQGEALELNGTVVYVHPTAPIRGA